MADGTALPFRGVLSSGGLFSRSAPARERAPRRRAALRRTASSLARSRRSASRGSPSSSACAASSSSRRSSASQASRRAESGGASSASLLSAQARADSALLASCGAKSLEHRLARFATAHAHSRLSSGPGPSSIALHSAPSSPFVSSKCCACASEPVAMFESAHATWSRVSWLARSSNNARWKAGRAPAEMTASVNCSDGRLTSLPSRRRAGPRVPPAPRPKHLTAWTRRGCGEGGAAPGARPAASIRAARTSAPPPSAAPPSRLSRPRSASWSIRGSSVPRRTWTK
mmetsp:Transcript_32176/g.95824  ORF Transcript_32176/g.95824 Transcript_32176/m.95824 type:complete len:287 (+) Transcript_32176:259-1119(+)